MSLDAASNALAWGAVGLQLSAYAIYVRRALRSKVRPNTASWLIWAYGGLLETTSYVVMSEDWTKSLLPAACNLASLATFAVLLGKGRFERISLWEWGCVVIDVSALLVWWHWHSAIWAHLVTQASIPVSFAPILIAVWRGQTGERPMPWALWSASYALGAAVVVLRWEQWPEIVFPAGNCLCHAAVGVLCERVFQRRWKGTAVSPGKDHT